jgi:hypothetical protein
MVEASMKSLIAHVKRQEVEIELDEGSWNLLESGATVTMLPDHGDQVFLIKRAAETL